MIAIICFVLVLVSGMIAVATDSAVFYRFINAAPFMEHPTQNTVALDTGETGSLNAVFKSKNGHF